MMINLSKIVKRNSSFDPDTGFFNRSYEYLNMECPTVRLNCPEIIKYIAYSLIQTDLDDAIHLIKRYTNLYAKIYPEDLVKGGNKKGFSLDDNKHILKGLFISSIMLYGKCFTEADKRKIKLEKKYFVSDQFSELHDTAMNFRNSFAVRAGELKLATSHDTAHVQITIPPESCQDFSPFLEVTTSRVDFPDVRYRDHYFEILFNDVRLKVFEKEKALGKDIINNIIKPKGLVYWYDKAKTVI